MESNAKKFEFIKEVVVEKFPEANQSEFEKEAKSWIHNANIVTWRVENNRHGNVLIIVERDTKYEVIRMFPAGIKGWHVSMDLHQGAPKEVFDYLIINS
jgi:hypothetical protein